MLSRYGQHASVHNRSNAGEKHPLEHDRCQRDAEVVRQDRVRRVPELVQHRLRPRGVAQRHAVLEGVRDGAEEEQQVRLARLRQRRRPRLVPARAVEERVAEPCLQRRILVRRRAERDDQSAQIHDYVRRQDEGGHQRSDAT